MLPARHGVKIQKLFNFVSTETIAAAMLYSFFRPLATAALFVYFRKIYLANTHRIPKGRPLIIVCNHPTAFMEPCIMACFLDRPLYFLVRGDFFVKPLFARILRLLHMLPVYRWKDGGYRNIKHNYSTFEACYRALAQNRTLMIFAEGRTIYEKRLRPIQKGPARIALGTLEHFPELEDVYILPVGVTYSAVDHFRSEVMIDCGEPLRTRDYTAAPDAIGALTEALADAMRARIVHVEDSADDTLAERLLAIDRASRPSPLFPFLSDDEGPGRRERELIAAMNALPAEDKEALRVESDALWDALRRSGFEAPPRPLVSAGVWERLFLVLGAIPAALGFAFNILPLRAARRLAEKKAPHFEFYAPMMVAAGMMFYVLYLLVLMVAGVILLGWLGLAFALSVPLLGYLALRWRDLWMELRQARQWRLDAGAEVKQRLALLGTTVEGMWLQKKK
jgi:glycerol-3-phosphate O-acyltransferase/dihydroxyacetone phosphate acyltransferase